MTFNESELLRAVECYPATIRKCDGIIIKLIDNEDKKPGILTALKILQSRGYNTYGLKYSDPDSMNEPKEIFNGAGKDINKFGWFLSKNKMDFPSSSTESCIQLSTRNRHYYTILVHKRYGEVAEKCLNIEDATSVSVYDMVGDSKIMKQIEFRTNGIEVVKRVRTEYYKNKKKK